MTLVKTFFAAATLSLVAFSAAAPASAAPFKLKQPIFKPQPGPKAKWNGGGGALAVGVIGGLALGAIAASAARPAMIEDDGCYTVRRKVWSDEFGGFVVRRVNVCD